MKRLLLVPFFLAIGFSGTVLPGNGANEKKIIQAVESRNYTAAIDELKALKANDEDAFTSADYDYLLGRMAEESGDLATAMQNYRSVAGRESLLRAYALKHLSEIARSTGNFMLERIYLNELWMRSSNSLLANSALLRLARNAFESGNYGLTTLILTRDRNNGRGVNAMNYSSLTRDAEALLAAALLRNGQAERSREIFASLINSVPNPAQPDDAALAAAKNLDLLDVGSEGLDKKVAALSESEHRRRANIYQFNREFVAAKLHFQAAIGLGSPADSADAVFQIGRGYAQQRNFVEALKWFERVLEQYPQTPAAKDALLQAASAYGRVGKPVEATTRYERFIEQFPADEKLDRAYLNIVDILRDHGEDTDALKWCAKIGETFRGKLPEAVAAFTEARIHIARNEWQRSFDSLEKLKSFAELGGATVPGGTTRNEVTFLRAFVLEHLAKYPEAIETYLSIPDGRGEYYGWHATERLKVMAATESAKPYIDRAIGAHSEELRAGDPDTRRRGAQAILRLTENPGLRNNAILTLQTTLKSLPKYSEIPFFKSVADQRPVTGDIADRLISLGLFDEAANELESEKPDISKLPPDKAYVLVNYYLRGNRADLALAFIEPLWTRIPADYPIELIDREQLSMLYPAPYAEYLLRYAPGRGVDPRLQLAIMRQESRFNPDAKSVAAARGLMQFIATTSIRVAGEVGRNGFRQEDLYYPPTAILFGSQYLADLFKIFPGQPEAVVASYNGGDDNMKRWLARSRSNEPDRFIPEIVYSQSKDYVQKVMASYRMYCLIYNEKLERN